MQVSLEQVGKSFGGVRALDGLTVTLPSGQNTALIGPNGSGKSTLTRILMGMLSFDGKVSVDGLDPVADRLRLAPRIAYVPQVAPRLAAPLQEIARAVSAMRGLPRDAVAAQCAAMELDLRAIGSRPLRNLSGGMRQKFLIALAFASAPELLVLDEPTASLDPAARQRFFELVDQLEPRPTIVLCSHRLEELRHLVHSVLVLGEGKLVFHGSAHEYLARRTAAVIEVRAHGDAAQWLTAAGFRLGIGGWWSKAARNGQRLEVLRHVHEACGNDLDDVIVRDFDAIDPKEFTL